jgi:hypothetical protein
VRDRDGIRFWDRYSNRLRDRNGDRMWDRNGDGTRDAYWVWSWNRHCHRMRDSYRVQFRDCDWVRLRYCHRDGAGGAKSLEKGRSACDLTDAITEPGERNA